MGRIVWTLLLLGASAAAVWLLLGRPTIELRPGAGGDGPAGTEAIPASWLRPAPDGPLAPNPTPVTPPSWGEPLHIELVEAPAASYGAPRWTEADRKYAADLDALGADVDYDPVLGRAARELAVFYSHHRQSAPSNALQFILDASGASEWGVLQSFMITSRVEDDDAVRARVEELRAQVSDLGEGVRVGVGESYILGPSAERVIAVIVSRGGLYLEPVPRRVGAGETITVAGTLPRAASAPSIVGMGPDGRFFDVEATTDGERFEAAFPAPSQRGALVAEIVARMPNGPIPLAQLTIHVDEAPPRRFDGRWPPDERGIETDQAATEEAMALLDIDRARHGLTPLVDDAALAAIAAAHSRDMRDSGFFGHVSPTTGSLSDRLRRAGYDTVLHAENVASNSSLWDAQAGLYESLGHRRNILSPLATRVGVGVVARELPSGGRTWYLTQVFARPVPEVDATTARRDLYARFDEASRTAAGGGFRRDPALERVAQREAEASAPTPGGVLDKARDEGLLERGARAWVAVAAELEGVEIPADIVREAGPRLGIGVYQDPERPAPNIVVVVVTAG